MNTVLQAIATTLPEPCYTTETLLAAAGDRFSPALHEMLHRLGVEARHSILSNYPQVLFDGAEPSWSVRGTAMAVRAARDCLNQSRIGADQIGLVIGVTNTPSRLVPGFVSDLMAQMPELPREAMNLSLQGQGCSPLLKAVDVARWFLATNPGRRVLIVCMESTTAMSQPLPAHRYHAFTEKRSAADVQSTVDVLHGFLFADGAVALMLGTEGDGPVFGPATHWTNDEAEDAELGRIDGAGSDRPAINGRPEYQLSPGITERGTFYAMNTANRLFAHAQSPIRSVNEASRVLIHTGSRKILDGICGRFEIEPDAVRVESSYRVLAKYGNLTGASLGFMIADALQTGPKGHVLLISFGLSFSGSAGVLTVN